MLVSFIDGITVEGSVARSGQVADRPLHVAGETPVVGQQLRHLRKLRREEPFKRVGDAR